MDSFRSSPQKLEARMTISEARLICELQQTGKYSARAIAEVFYEKIVLFMEIKAKERNLLRTLQE